MEGTPFDFREGRPVGGTRLDHCFTDLERDDAGLAPGLPWTNPSGRDAPLALGRRGAICTLWCTPATTDRTSARRSIAVEPMTCPPQAFRSGEALVTLEPGESHTCDVGAVTHDRGENFVPLTLICARSK